MDGRLRQQFGRRQVRRHRKHREQLIIKFIHTLGPPIHFSKRFTYIIVTPLHTSLFLNPPSSANYYLVITISYEQPNQSWPSRLAGWSCNCYLSRSLQ